MRQYSIIDSLLTSADNSLRTLGGGYSTTNRSNPADSHTEAEMTTQEIRHVGGLMRINHCGEVCAQALYQGQSLTARLPQVREKMELAAKEENDHLDWCHSRLIELNTHTSWLNPLWYLGSFGIGAVAGAAGDQWSLGFVVETEHQVVKHLEGHINQLPTQDNKSYAILEQMKEDELNHATAALEAGGAELPPPVKRVMKLISKIMTKTAYYV